MCGIAGIAYAGPPRDLSRVVRGMIDVQRHRGPDGQGFYSSPGVELGHCRLAILDLSPAGHQPMAYQDNRFWITFNGEIYNYVELREQLRQAGHRFRSRSDTEVLLAAYAEWGEACLGRLRGMFAFAIWDERQRRVFAARDRFGIKPFHYWVAADKRQISFSSEAKALLHFLPERRIDAKMARDFIAWNLLDHEPAQTMLQGILQLPAGHFLTWAEREGVCVRRYWSLEVSEELSARPEDRSRLVSEFRERLQDSVSVHLRSDVPVGTCLSGGLDSSAIVCVMSAELSRRGAANEKWQHTFSACFDDPALDERRYIQSVTLKTQTLNHQVFPSGERLAEEMEQWLWHQESPVGGCGAYAQYCVARLSRDHGIKVLLDGQGADEQLAGYRKFILVYLHQLIGERRYMRALREGLAFGLSREILKTSRFVDGRRYLFGSLPEAARLWRDEARPRRPDTLGLATSLGRRLHADMHLLSLPLLLRFEDRNTMAFGVESRVPFVDHVLAEWVAKLPADLRLWRGWTKWILREAFADMLPPLVRHRKSKLGFSTPQSQWMRGPLTKWLAEMLAAPKYLGELVDPGRVSALLENHRRHRSSPQAESLLFRLAAYENWARLFLGTGTAVAERRSSLTTGSLADRPVVERLNIRVCAMTSEMVSDVCQIHLGAFSGHMSARLGSAYVRAFFSWFVRNRNAVALVAVDSRGAVLGYVVGAPAGYSAGMSRDLAWIAARSLLAHPSLLFDSKVAATVTVRLRQIFTSTAEYHGELPSPMMSLVGIGVASAMAGRRIGRALVQAFEEKARDLGMASLRLSVYQDNAAARRLYENCGWQALTGGPSSTGTIYYGRALQVAPTANRSLA